MLDVGSFGRRGAAVDEAFNSGLMLILLKFRPIGQIQIARIDVDNSAILKDKFFVDIDIVDIGGGGFNSIDHAETSPRQYMPSFQNTTVLLGLVHLRIPLFLLILCRTGRSDDGGVNNSADPVHETGLFKTCIQLCKKVFADVVVLKELAEMLKGHRVRNLLFGKVDALKFAESVDVMDISLGALSGQVEPHLEKIHP